MIPSHTPRSIMGKVQGANTKKTPSGNNIKVRHILCEKQCNFLDI